MARKIKDDRPDHHGNEDYERKMHDEASNTLASCYVVDASSAMLQAFHYSTTGAGGMFIQPDGVPEVGSGSSTPSSSPPLGTYIDGSGPKQWAAGCREGAAYTITEECERLFCDTMRHVFLSEGTTASGPRVLDTEKCEPSRSSQGDGTIDCLSTQRLPAVEDWIEMWDYGGGTGFRGFVAAQGEQRILYVFFEPAIIGHDLKHGLMALMELASTSWLDCDHMTVCLARQTPSTQLKNLMRDLGWVGFRLGTVALGATTAIMVESAWVFLSLEV
ncbi:MAG: hypothetical protein M1817_000982 [Caeruleum heppii]|nr:MAG: hypothetical protein M1817_000982 [Caeruleum heppii]